MDGNPVPITNLAAGLKLYPHQDIGFNDKRCNLQISSKTGRTILLRTGTYPFFRPRFSLILHTVPKIAENTDCLQVMELTIGSAQMRCQNHTFSALFIRVLYSVQSRYDSLVIRNHSILQRYVEINPGILSKHKTHQFNKIINIDNYAVAGDTQHACNKSYKSYKHLPYKDSFTR